MKLKQLVIILSIVFFVSSVARGQDIPAPQDDKVDKNTDLGCLPEEWAQINPTEADKNFDMENDFDKSGDRISCDNYITPTELDAFFKKIKKAVQFKDKEALADLILYPSHTLITGYTVTKENQMKLNSMPIANRQDFIDHYDEIMLPTTIKIIQCMQLDNIFAHRYMGTGTTHGEFWFHRDIDTRELSIYRFSSDYEGDKPWLSKECHW